MTCVTSYILSSNLTYVSKTQSHSSLLKESEPSTKGTILSVVVSGMIAISSRSLYVLCSKLFSNIVVLDGNGEHNVALLPPCPYEPSSIRKAWPFTLKLGKEHNYLKLLGLNYKMSWLEYISRKLCVDFKH